MVAVGVGGADAVDVLTGLQRANILGTRNFVHPDLSVYATEESHGCRTISDKIIPYHIDELEEFINNR